MKTTKRLFSWLIVLAMVLSMVPVFDLPAFAATEVEEEAPAAPAEPTVEEKTLATLNDIKALLEKNSK